MNYLRSTANNKNSVFCLLVRFFVCFDGVIVFGLCLSHCSHGCVNNEDPAVFHMKVTHSCPY